MDGIEIWRYTFRTEFPDGSDIYTEHMACNEDMAWEMYEKIGKEFTVETHVEIVLAIQWL